MLIRKCDIPGTQLEACTDAPDGECRPLDLGLLLYSFPNYVIGSVCCCSSGYCNGPIAPDPTGVTTDVAFTTQSGTLNSAAVFCYDCIRNDTTDACSNATFLPDHPRVGHELCNSGLCSTVLIPAVPLVGLNDPVFIRQCDLPGKQTSACTSIPKGECGQVDIGEPLMGIPNFLFADACCCEGHFCNGPFPPPDFTTQGQNMYETTTEDTYETTAEKERTTEKPTEMFETTMMPTPDTSTHRSETTRILTTIERFLSTVTTNPTTREQTSVSVSTTIPTSMQSTTPSVTDEVDSRTTDDMTTIPITVNQSTWSTASESAEDRENTSSEIMKTNELDTDADSEVITTTSPSDVISSHAVTEMLETATASMVEQTEMEHVTNKSSSSQVEYNSRIIACTFMLTGIMTLI
ncbi:uncharacterized protein [Amphiura filiformis]|uniref:uncharacterized protein n=1 Tax=Amphiura filiformis TaxID=82378 RepID=UPI003B216854